MSVQSNPSGRELQLAYGSSESFVLEHLTLTPAADCPPPRTFVVGSAEQ
jgi:hypothetical protein